MMELRPGDYFCVRTKSWIADAIIKVQLWKSLDHEARYNHAGIIVHPDGTTFESLQKIAHYGIQGYVGCPVLIVRHKEMTPERFLLGYEEVKKWDQFAYPWWRLALSFFGLAKWIHPAGIPVCSELVVEHLHHAGLVKHDGYGWTPDALADKFKSRCYEVIYEGIL